MCEEKENFNFLFKSKDEVVSYLREIQELLNNEHWRTQSFMVEFAADYIETNLEEIGELVKDV